MILLYILLALAAICLIISYICFRITFYVPKKIIIGPDDYPIPDGKIYEPYREQMVAWMKEVRQLPCREITTTSAPALLSTACTVTEAPPLPRTRAFFPLQSMVSIWAKP